jgi:predicted ATPase with chaperone activity
MRFRIDDRAYQDMQAAVNPPADCYVRPGEYLHHLYQNGEKFVIARALVECLKQAELADDTQAVLHLSLHKKQLDALIKQARSKPDFNRQNTLGDPSSIENFAEQTSPPHTPRFQPVSPLSWEQTGLPLSLLFELILRVIYHRGRLTGSEISSVLGLSYPVIGPILQDMRQKDLIDIVGQGGLGEMHYEYSLKPPRGHQAAEDALFKSGYVGPAPVSFQQYLEGVQYQTIHKLVVTHQNIRKAFFDLVISESLLNEIGPAINAADSIFLFGNSGNGKTSIAERITRLLGDDIYIPHAIVVDGQIIKFFDPMVHIPVHLPPNSPDNQAAQLIPDNPASVDQRWIKINRPTILVGGELTLSMLELSYNQIGKFYEAPLQLKANCGIFMIDDFGRQLVRSLDLLNRWIVPLEKKVDYLKTITGSTFQIPFDLLLIFSTNLDPDQLVDEAFLRRIKYKIEIKDPDEDQWRKVWELACTNKKLDLDQQALDYLLARWYTPYQRPLRMCHPRDLLNQMINIAAYSVEQFAFTPDLIDAACQSYFINRG